MTMNDQVTHLERRENLRKGVYLLPNLFTTGSLFAGFYSIVATMNGNYQVASWFILVSGIFDVLDGKIARLTKTTSRFGVEYDSLSDLISFGVAPGLLIYSWALKPFGKIGWLAAFLYVVCGALRLARFNVQINSVESKRFIGLPIPAAASALASCVLLFYYLGAPPTFKKVSILLLIYVLAFLMVSNFRYFSFKDPELVKRQPFGFLVLGILLFVVVVSKPEVFIFIIFFSYMVSGPTTYILRFLRLRKKPQDIAKEPTESKKTA